MKASGRLLQPRAIHILILSLFSASRSYRILGPASLCSSVMGESFFSLREAQDYRKVSCAPSHFEKRGKSCKSSPG